MDGSTIIEAAAGIAAALARAQLEMGPALKDSTNPAFKTKYADLSSVMAACMPALNHNGIAVIQPIGGDERGRWVDTVLIHGETGQQLACRVDLIIGKNDMQGYGSAVTYARRYGLMSMAGIAPEDDDGNEAAKAAPVVERRPRPDQAAEHEAGVSKALALIESADSLDDLKAVWSKLPDAVRMDRRAEAAKDGRKDALRNADLSGDGIPY